ncbi:nicotinamide N-methyltransferase [Esox lucius]|uniref:Nicotinamide N-methyltransferase n=1 Tax=Esox lucius TaxID=8010 RepID=A0A3P8XWY8_ESOLU|nr:nicotinamide N-methyltransferase [Esox lucius]XP_034149313.1 nicotinamide N-methyltransferase [Esox lucius]
MGENHQARFDPKTYFDYCYQFATVPGQKDNRRFVNFVLCQLSKTFSTGKYQGQRLIEVGTGPTVHTLISACQYYDEILASDYVDSNRSEIERWLRAEEGCFDWSAHMQYVCDLEGKRTPQIIADTLRQKVKRVLKCDVCLENPFHPIKVPPADCVISSLCLEAACKDRESYRRSLSSVAGLLRSGGVLVLIGDLDENYYTVGEQRFACVNLNQEFITATLSELGLTVEEFNLQQAEDRTGNLKCDYAASFHLIAVKR